MLIKLALKASELKRQGPGTGVKERPASADCSSASAAHACGCLPRRRWITGRKPGDKFLEYAQMTGMILLLGLLIFANGNDILRAFR